MSPGKLALLLLGIAVACAAVAIATPGLREAAVVVGLFFAFLAGGVLNWDRRGGH
ncbi:MAG: hypothetical protein ACRDI2_22915 [Chloroflexota bacterium]